MTTTSDILSPDDAALLTAYADARSQSAFHALTDRHAPWVFAAAFRQLQDRHLAEDATQAVFLLLAQRAHAMSDAQKQKITGWLFNTLHFVVQNLKRARYRRQQHEQKSAFMKAGLLTRDEPAIADIATLAAALDAAVAKLSHPDRLAILLRFYQNHDYTQIAHALCTTESSARKRLTRAIARLRHHLGKSGKTLDASSLTLAATHGLSQFPHTLPATLTHLATSSATVPLNTTAILKGVAYLMTIAKLQTTVVIVIAVILLLTIPAVMIARHAGSTPSEPLASPTTTSVPDDPLAQITRVYGLKDDQFFALIHNASPEAHIALYTYDHPEHLTDPTKAQYIETLKQYSIDVKWDGDTPLIWGVGAGIRNPEAFASHMGLYSTQIQVNTPFPELKGDLVFRGNATPEQYRDSFETLLRKESNRPITVSFRDVEAKVIVLTGNWQHKSRIEIYGKELNENPAQGGGASGATAAEFAGHLGEWINQQVLIEASNSPRKISWHDNDAVVDEAASRFVHDKTLVLNNIAEQTGLTWSEEIRTVRRLFIESADSAHP